MNEWDRTEPGSEFGESTEVPAPKPSKNYTSTQIRVINLAILIASVFVTPIVSVLIWVIIMRQYDISFLKKFTIWLFSGLLAPILVIALSFEGIDTTGPSTLGEIVRLCGFIIILAPFIYAFVKPLGNIQKDAIN